MNKQVLALAIALLSAAAPAAAAEYTLRPGDQLSIVVAQDADISSDMKGADKSPYFVRPDGTVSFPYVGTINANGMTVEQFTELLRTDLAPYYVNPDVTVNIYKLGTIRVHVLGEAHKPGTYELTKGHTVIDAIGAAGSFTWDTAKKKILLIHQGDTEMKQAIPINLNNLLTKGDLSQNYELQEGDILYLYKNGRISFQRDIMPFLTGAYYVNRIENDDD